MDLCQFILLKNRIRSFQHEDDENIGNVEPMGKLDKGDRTDDDELPENQNRNTTGRRSSFLAKLAIALGVAAALTVISFGIKGASFGSLLGVQRLAEVSPSSTMDTTVGFTFKAFGYRFMLPEYAPGWIYFWLLMAAGCGLFISEEALNIWVGITLAQLLSLDGTWHSFVESLSRNAPYIISTVLWVYWGVCISDMIPFYLGKLFRESGASDDVCSKLGIGEEKVLQIRRAVQKYGNLIGFIERFSLGVRNPTAFLAGSLVSKYFYISLHDSVDYVLGIECEYTCAWHKEYLLNSSLLEFVVVVWSLFQFREFGLCFHMLWLLQLHYSCACGAVTHPSSGLTSSTVGLVFILCLQ
ncbi:hypothetical protein GOBAR_AA26068 [Gossypium barbadense]|uniref:Uncharacterized protein n=1 Tax=Gossypium barbadense TaxID=3634 RepID=A0A2P5WU23_GOSBA|nr:hypothetical protein GOBAR_AA26068 [Gossypium barbadense]